MPARTIQRVPAPSAREFRRNYEDTRRPVVLTGALAAWPALSRWTREYLVRAHGDASVTLRISDLGARQLFDGDPLAAFRREETTLAAFLTEASSDEPTRRAYLQYCDIPRDLPRLSRDIAPLAYRPRMLVSPPMLWLCGAGTVNPLHYDMNHVLMAQITGRKRYVLFSPRDSAKLASRFDRVVWRTTPLDVEQPDRARFPDLDAAEAWECILEPGELLFIPYRYWHYASAAELNIAVSTWYEPGVATRLRDAIITESLQPVRATLRRLGIRRSLRRSVVRASR